MNNFDQALEPLCADPPLLPGVDDTCSEMDALHQVVRPIWMKPSKDLAHFAEVSILEEGILTVEVLLPEGVRRETSHVGLPVRGDVHQLF